MGMSNPEEWGTWTDSDKVCFRFKINSGNRSAHGILTATAFNGGQNVQIYAISIISTLLSESLVIPDDDFINAL